MEIEDMALETIKITINEEGYTTEILDQPEGRYVIDRVRKIVTPIESRIRRSHCIEPCGSCVEPYRRISIYALQQVNMVLNLNPVDDDSVSENLEWRQRIDQQLNKFEEIYDKFSQIDLGLHPSQTASSPSRLNMILEGQAGEEHFANKLVGIVENKRFVPFVDFGGKFPRRLTELQTEEGQLPESKEINLDNYEGLVMMVSGNDSGNWIYAAKIVEVGGVILSAIAKKVFG